MIDQPGHSRGALLGGPRLPEVTHAAQGGDRNAFGGKLGREVLIEPGPAAIAGKSGESLIVKRNGVPLLWASWPWQVVFT